MGTHPPLISDLFDNRILRSILSIARSPLGCIHVLHSRDVTTIQRQVVRTVTDGQQGEVSHW